MSATVLLLDAEPVVRSAVTKMLEAHGYTVHAVSDLDAALEVAKNIKPDLLMTNIYLPGISGYDAAKRLREDCPNLRVMMVAGLPADEKIHDREVRSNFASFPKPFTAQQLVHKVKEVLFGVRMDC